MAKDEKKKSQSSNDSSSGRYRLKIDARMLKSYRSLPKPPLRGKYLGSADIVFRELSTHVLMRTILPVRDWKHLAQAMEDIHRRYPDTFIVSFYIQLYQYGDKEDD